MGESGKSAGELIRSGTRRIWRAWKAGIAIAIVFGVIAFIIGMSVEVSHKRTELPGEEPLNFFSVKDPVLASGMNEYTITIENNQDYVIEEVAMEFRGVSADRPQDLMTDDVGSVGTGGSNTYGFIIPQGAESAQIILDGEQLIGFTNIDLAVRGPSGSQEWTSENMNDNDESITLSVTDIHNAGYGNYTITVSHQSGLQDVSYTISTTVKFKTPVVRMTSAAQIQPGGAQDFTFLLDIPANDMGSVQFHVKAKVNIGENFNIEIWQLYRSDWGIEDNYLPTPNEEKGGEPFGPVDTTGIVSIVAYTIAVVSGIVLWARMTFMEAVKPKFMQPVHCFASLMSLMFAIDHTLIALQKDWPWTSSGMVFSYLAIGTLGFYTVFSFYDVEGKEYFGEKKWRYIHIILLLILILWVVLHFGLMGDHLGFLK